MSGFSVQPISRFGRAAVDGVVRLIPSVTFKNKKVIDSLKWAGQHISSPQNRLILGATALMSQPFIDLHNRDVDEKTKKVSAARTVAKIIAGTSTGFFVRYYCIKAVEAFTNNPQTAANRLRTLFFPEKAANITIKGLKHYKMALGTILSLGVMMITNLLIDAPLTKFLTNKFIKRIDDKDNQKLTKQSLYFTPKPQIDKFTRTNLNDKEVK